MRRGQCSAAVLAGAALAKVAHARHLPTPSTRATGTAYAGWGEACMWEGAIERRPHRGIERAGRELRQRLLQRLCANHPLNDRVLYIIEFGVTFEVKVFDSSYQDPSTCIEGGDAIGPYPFSSDRISSFRAC